MGKMVDWVVTFEHGPHMADSVIVQAATRESAMTKGYAKAKARYKNPACLYVKKVSDIVAPVEEEVKAKELTVAEIEKLLGYKIKIIK